MALQPDDAGALSVWLAARGVTDRAVTAIATAGEGNMNRVLRAQLDDGSTLIIKQALPWVAKYPDIAAPIERCVTEAAFYAALADHDRLAARTPTVLLFDAADHVLVLEDLGSGSDFSGLYSAGADSLNPADAARLMEWLSDLHAANIDPASWPALTNDAMRALNHTHIFEVPFADPPALDLDTITPGLAALAAGLRSDRVLRDIVRSLGSMYLGDSGTNLLHGDFYPGSWLAHTGRGPLVIDPEFGFFGHAEFDVGIFRAHILLAGGSNTSADALQQAYRPPPGFDAKLAGRFAGIEIIRRLLGVAQLPLVAGLDRKRTLLEQAVALAVDS